MRRRALLLPCARGVAHRARPLARPLALPLALLLALAPPAGAEPAPEGPHLVQAKVLFQGLEYERCVALLSPQPAQSAEHALYRGLCLHGLGREEKAASALRAARAQDPRITPPSFCSPKVKAFFAAAVGVPLALVEVASDAVDAPPRRVPVPARLPETTALAPASVPGRRLPAATPLVLGGASAVALGAGILFGVRSGAALQRQHVVAARHEARLAGAGFAVSLASALAAGVSAWLLREEPPPPAREQAPAGAAH